MSCILLLAFWGFGLPGGAQGQSPLSAAQTALATGQFETAITLAGSLARDAPYDAAMIAARSHLELGQTAAALQAVQQAQAVRPKDSAAHALEGLIYLRQDRPGRAMFSLRRGLDLAQTPQEKSIARGFLRRSQSQQTWLWRGGFGLAPASNVNKATTASSITLLFPGAESTVEAQFDWQA